MSVRFLLLIAEQRPAARLATRSLQASSVVASHLSKMFDLEFQTSSDSYAASR